MRARMILLVLCLSALPALGLAQHTHQFEIGAFASFTRYDRAFSLDNQIGGGGRLASSSTRPPASKSMGGIKNPAPTPGAPPPPSARAGPSLPPTMATNHTPSITSAD